MSARVTNSTDQGASNVALAPVAFDTSQWDTGNPTPFLDSGFQFIAPITGKYLVVAQAEITTDAAITTFHFIATITRSSDNVVLAFADFVGTAATVGISQSVLLTTFVALTAGQAVEFDILAQAFNDATPVTSTIDGNTGGPSPTQSSPVFQISLIEPG